MFNAVTTKKEKTHFLEKKKEKGKSILNVINFELISRYLARPWWPSPIILPFNFLTIKINMTLV
jgi:hypothetical protein